MVSVMACRWHSYTTSRVVSSARAHSTDTDFGAVKVQSNPATGRRRSAGPV